MNTQLKELDDLVRTLLPRPTPAADGRAEALDRTVAARMQIMDELFDNTEDLE
ncbi:hypothetical protein SS50377_20490 [Spironucleus salmonicida]|uniref:Uncharacterized protein n=1 Tax=Spironucleus salmonicida TaxID=348837 RepID=V6LSM4_9EUKA|nr:hypothetical protein SS50377_20479 [Spironucleus salmonicida]KAH0577139.1 hypothetical protein SS50377_20490 [Spironucleus salmonicida]|eukprot:EST43784.1 Hypothetical protein SS50377_16401 [Spironucleus salmonicida]